MLARPARACMKASYACCSVSATCSRVTSGMRAMKPPRVGDCSRLWNDLEPGFKVGVRVTLSTEIGAQRVHIAGHPPISTVIHGAFFLTSLDKVLRGNEDHRRVVVREIESVSLCGVPGSPAGLLPTARHARGARDRAMPGVLSLPPVRGRSASVTH